MPKAPPTALEIDPTTWLAKYIATPSCGMKTSVEYMCEQLRLAVQAGRTTQGRLHLGQGLHTLEDYYAHSNFCEVALIELGHRGVIPWTALRVAPPVRAHYPIVTGVFGDADLAASLILTVAEKLAKSEEECEFWGDPPWWMTVAAIVVRELLYATDGLSEGSPQDQLWDQEADTMLKLLFYVRESGALKTGDSAWNVIKEATLRSEAYVRCMTALQVKKFTSAVLGALVDLLADDVLGHEIVFDGRPSGVVRDLGNEIGHVETLERGFQGVPTHTQLSKDHDDHPLHDLAGHLAGIAIKHVSKAVADAWQRKSGPEDACLIASSFFVHPSLIQTGDKPMEQVTFASKWAGRNPVNVGQAGDLRWVEKHREHWEETKQRARRLLAQFGLDSDAYVRVVEDALRAGSTSATASTP